MSFEKMAVGDKIKTQDYHSTRSDRDEVYERLPSTKAQLLLTQSNKHPHPTSPQCPRCQAPFLLLEHEDRSFLSMSESKEKWLCSDPQCGLYKEYHSYDD